MEKTLVFRSNYLPLNRRNHITFFKEPTTAPSCRQRSAVSKFESNRRSRARANQEKHWIFDDGNGGNNPLHAYDLECAPEPR
jgi:hypothetical protein